MDWGNSPYYLDDLMDNHVAPKLFNNLSILCLGSEFVPLAVPSRARVCKSPPFSLYVSLKPSIILGRL